MFVRRTDGTGPGNNPRGGVHGHSAWSRGEFVRNSPPFLPVDPVHVSCPLGSVADLEKGRRRKVRTTFVPAIDPYFDRMIPGTRTVGDTADPTTTSPVCGEGSVSTVGVRHDRTAQVLVSAARRIEILAFAISKIQRTVTTTRTNANVGIDCKPGSSAGGDLVIQVTSTEVRSLRLFW